MDLSKYNGKYVRITDKWGETCTGMAEYGNHAFLECEYGGGEDGIFIEDCLIYHSQIVSIEEIKVLEYLTRNEGIPRVTAWCAAENIGSQRVLEKAGMQFVNTEKNGLVAGDRVYDKLVYEYRG